MGDLRKKYEKVAQQSQTGTSGPWFDALQDLLEEIVDRIEPKLPAGAAEQGIRRIRPDRDTPRE